MGPTYTIAYVSEKPVSTDTLLEAVRSAATAQAERLGVRDLLVYLAHEGGGTPYRTAGGQAGILGIELVHDDLMSLECPGVPCSDHSLARCLFREGLVGLEVIGVHAVAIADN